MISVQPLAAAALAAIGVVAAVISPPAIRQWKGDSVGRWDGDTLVVDTRRGGSAADEAARKTCDWIDTHYSKLR